MSTAPKYIPHYTIDDYQLWKGDWELWEGVPVAMTPSPFGRHGNMLAKIASALSNAIDEVDCLASVLLEVDWIVTNDTIVRPDLSIVCGAPPEGHIESAPALVVEILSASTRERDLAVKRRLFEQQSVQWYLIIDPDDKILQPLRLSASGVGPGFPMRQSTAVVLAGQCPSLPLSQRSSFLFRGSPMQTQARSTPTDSGSLLLFFDPETTLQPSL